MLGTLVASALSTPLEILNYKDEEAGHGHVMSGEPGVQVEGEYFWKVYYLFLHFVESHKQIICVI